MALPGNGYRTAVSMMMEMSFCLLEPVIYTTLTAPVSGANPATATVGSLGMPVNALYPGAEIVIDLGTRNQEVVTVLTVNPADNTFTANFLFPHAIGALVQGATFPVQAESGDPFYTQTEILSYIARAQNEFISDVPCIFYLNTQFAQFGQIYQQLVCDAVEFHHAASSSMAIPLTSLTRAGGSGFGQGGFGGGGFGGGGNPSPGTVTAITQGPHGLLPGYKFSVFNCDDPSLDGAFRVATVPNPTTITYIQYAPDSTVTGPECGMIVLWKRLYLTSQEELGIQNPFWRDQNITEIHSVYEDRCGNYRFGIDGKLAATLPLEILVAIRDTNALEQTDGFLVPDLVLHYIRMKALQFCLDKDSEMRDPMRAKYFSARYDRGVQTVRRWLDGMGIVTGMPRLQRAVGARG